MTLPTPPRKQWFLERIGTRVWPSRNSCNCLLCDIGYTKGYFIKFSADAIIFYNDELADDKLTYFSTKEERDEHERRTENKE